TSAPTPSAATTGLVVNAKQGAGVAWKFNRKNHRRHQVKDGSGMGLFDSRARLRAGSYVRRFASAGLYPWYDPRGVQHGIIRVPIKLTKLGNRSVDVRWSSAKPRLGFAFDIQLKRPGSTFKNWKIGVRTLDATFNATK